MGQRHTVAVLLFDRVNAVDVAGPVEAFADVKNERGQRRYDVVTWGIETLTVRSESGLRLCADSLIPKRPRADTLLVPGGAGVREPETLEKIANWLRRHEQKFGRIVSICTGAYALCEAGILDGHAVTTHWAHADDLRRRYPKVEVTADVLSLRDGRFCSSGGVTAGIDLALDLIESDVGTEAAMKAAREMVVFLRRPGAQSQFSLPLQMQAQAPDRLGSVCKWAASNLDADLSVEALAAKAGLSSRQFARRFKDTFGAPPAAYVKRVRLDAGRTLLTNGVGIGQAARAIGFLSIDGFRRAFEGRFGVSPSEYRKRFASTEDFS